MGEEGEGMEAGRVEQALCPTPKSILALGGLMLRKAQV